MREPAVHECTASPGPSGTQIDPTSSTPTAVHVTRGLPQAPFRGTQVRQSASTGFRRTDQQYRHRPQTQPLPGRHMVSRHRAPARVCRSGGGATGREWLPAGAGAGCPPAAPAAWPAETGRYAPGSRVALGWRPCILGRDHSLAGWCMLVAPAVRRSRRDTAGAAIGPIWAPRAPESAIVLRACAWP